jgi:hypothetical protein
VVIAVCNRKVINSRDEVVLEHRLPFPSGVVDGSTLIRKSVRWGSNLIGEPAVGLFRRDALTRTGMCDASNPYLSDLSLWAQLLRQGDAFLDPDYLAAFRISGKAASARIGHNQGASFRTFVRTLRQDPFYRIRWFDVLAGSALSYQWCLLRNLFIKYHSKNLLSTQSEGRASFRSPIWSNSLLTPGLPESGPQAVAPPCGRETDLVVDR